jgi:hypothetical protein
MAENNPSVVNDESGNNYGNIGTGGSMGQAQMQYLDNLQKLAMKAPPRPLGPDQYMPGEAQGIQRGTYSSRETGSVPLFAASNLIPFAMMDEMRRSVAEEETKYYASLKTELDKPLISKNIHLDNPAAQPAFWNKFQTDVDGMLVESTNRQGGNAMLGQISLAHDRKFLQYVNGVDQYAKMYNDVYAKAKDVKDKLKEPSKWYVSEDQKANLNKFLTTQDIFTEGPEKMSMDKLVKSSIDFGAKESVFALAEAATKGIQESITEDYPKLSTMSNDEMNVYITKKTTGYEKQAEDIYNDTVKFNDYGPEMNALLKKEIKARVQYGTTYSINQVKKANADRDLALKKMGVDVQSDGSIKFGTTQTALTGGIASYPVNFPNDKPMPSSTSMNGYIMYQGSIHHVKTDQSFPMTLKAEYNTGSEDKNLPAGRKTEVNVDFQSTAPYEAQKTMKMNNIMVPVGDPRGQTQITEASLTDMDTGQVIKLMGNQTMLVPSEQLNKTVEANFPGMAYVHQKLQGQLQQRQNYTGMGESPDTPIDIPTGADMSFVKDDPNIYYRNKSGKIVNGATLYDLIRKNK